MPDIVLIHGMWSHPGVLEPLRAYLSNRGHRVHVPLLPGHDPAHPWSRDLLANLSIRDLVEAVDRFLDESDFDESPTLVGHSMGGLVAQLVSARRNVGGLVLLNSAGPRGANHIYPSSVLATLFVLFQPFFWKRTNRPQYPSARFGLFNRVPLGLAREIHASLGRESGRCFFELVFWFFDRARTTRIDFAKIDAPILIVVSGKDRIVHPRVGFSLRSCYPTSELHHCPQNGHWLCHEPGSHKIFGKLEDWIVTATSRRSGSSIGDIRNLHHALPRLPSLSSPPVSSQHPPGFRRFLDRSWRVRRSAAEDAAADRGTFLSRPASARQRPCPDQRPSQSGRR